VRNCLDEGHVLLLDGLELALGAVPRLEHAVVELLDPAHLLGRLLLHFFNFRLVLLFFQNCQQSVFFTMIS